jgi:hypothetical protein
MAAARRPSLAGAWGLRTPRRAPVAGPVAQTINVSLRPAQTGLREFNRRNRAASQPVLMNINTRDEQAGLS